MDPDNVNDDALDEEAKVFLSQIYSEVEQPLRSPANDALWSKAYRGQDEEVREALADGGNELIALCGYRDARALGDGQSLAGDAVCDHWRDGKEVDDNLLPKPLLLMRQAEKEKNGKKAILLLAQAAAEGYPDAVVSEIGYMYSVGKSTPKALNLTRQKHSNGFLFCCLVNIVKPSMSFGLALLMKV